MTVRNAFELEGLQAAGKAVADALQTMVQSLEEGMSTLELDAIGREVLDGHGAESAPIVDYKFPGTTCISLNDEAAHGIPSQRTLKKGDLINIDVSAVLDGFYADSGYTVHFGVENGFLVDLCNASQSALQKALSGAQAGKPLNRIGWIIEREAKQRGYRVIRNLAGHGTGRKLHEAPHDILNFYAPSVGGRLKPGMVLAIETFLSTGAEEVVETGDGWTLVTPDGSRVAQYEHTIVVTDGAPLVLTSWN